MRKSISAITAALLAALLLPSVAFAYWPVANRYSYVSQGYSTRHKAYDIASATGTAVKANKSGRVVYVGWTANCGGRQIYVYHGNGIYSAYFHLSTTHVYKGKWVTASTTIARVGTTGCTTGPHLHFEIWHGYPWSSGSYRVNPCNYIDSGYWFPYRYR